MNILYISYFYPPLGGPASLRNVKTIKYLSELGCKIDVLTVKEIEYNYLDNSLQSETKEHSIIRTASYDPMALMKRLLGKRPATSQTLYKNTPERLKLLIRRMYPLDDKVGWLPPLIAAGNRALNSGNYDLIYVSCGPFSSAIAAWWLGKRHKIPYAAEMRDYWTLLSDYDLHGSAMQHAFARYWEKRILCDAKWIITATKGIGKDLSTAFGDDLTNKMLTMYNGHDEEDYTDLPLLAPRSKGFVLSYFGALYARRSLKCFYTALKELAEAKLLPMNTQVKLFGNYNIETQQDVEHSGIKDMITITASLNHKEALQHMAESDALILVINSSSPYGTLTSKVFEYLRIGKPILALVPSTGEAAELLAESGQSYICAMESVSSIKACIIRLLDARYTEPTFSYAAAKYSRKAQVGALYHFLKS
ncbi:MAG: glycosyltransferase [Candidatus Cloacimonetes bacterium]|nr:glycosyltransferase [Candidatus Cloacimonadota bacterium]